MIPTAHPTDDALILHFYGETAEAERTALDAHLAECAECGRAWRALKATLSLVDAAEIPEPAPAFERTMWVRVQPALTAPPARHAWWTWRLAVPLAAAALLIVAFSLGRISRTTPAVAPAPVAANAAAASKATREHVLMTALDDHFERSELLLVELLNAKDPKQLDVTFDRSTASDLVASNRLYRSTAEENGDTHLASLLEQLEGVLIEVAHSPEQVSQSDLDALHARIASDSLLFKVRAVANEIEQRQQHPLTMSEGTL